MKYDVIYIDKALKSLRKIDKSVLPMIKAWIDKNLVGTENPRQHGKGLTANRSGQWRYRVGDYRILAEIQDDKLIIIVVEVGHRKNVYER